MIIYSLDQSIILIVSVNYLDCMSFLSGSMYFHNVKRVIECLICISVLVSMT